MMSQEMIMQLATYLNQASITIFYGGAGTSTESGVPDYRGRFGTWTKMEEEHKNPLYFANIKRLKEDPVAFFKIREEVDRKEPEPNFTHRLLANLERNGQDIRVITQNVDGLHQKAGQVYVDELHGDTREWFCMDCRRSYPREALQKNQDKVAYCRTCGGILRPNVIYFGESIPHDVMKRARWSMEQADLLIIAGTTLTTPAAKRLVQHFKGEHIVIMNYDPLDIAPLEADLFIRQPIGQVMQQVAPFLDHYHSESSDP